MRLWSDNFPDGGAIPDGNAFCRPDPATHVTLSDNRSPHLAWDDVPEGTRSFALACIDIEVPTVGTDVNKEGRTVPASLPRCAFAHWLLADIPASVRELAEGAHGVAVTPRGKSGPDAPNGMRHGVNDYTGWFSGDGSMSGKYFGWDGPCPPWNDEKVHRYRFTLYALEAARLPVEGEFDMAAFHAALAGHVLDAASLVGTFTFRR